MKLAPPTTLVPVHDYDDARKRAVSWLGDRYLLAEPAPRRREQPKPYFVEARSWHVAVGAGVQRRTH